MEIKRKEIISRFPWLMQKKCQYIVSSSYDGLICASFLNHFLKWELVGYYDLESLWICEQDAQNYNDIIWVDLGNSATEWVRYGNQLNITNSGWRLSLTPCQRDQDAQPLSRRERTPGLATQHIHALSRTFSISSNRPCR